MPTPFVGLTACGSKPPSHPQPSPTGEGAPLTITVRINSKIESEVSSMNQRRNILFICSRNQWRSPTAEQTWRKHPLLSVKSAGTSPSARRKVSDDDIRWAEVIFVMEEKHKSRLVAEFTSLIKNKTIHVLDIPDEYKYMDPELVEQLEQSVGALLDLT
jgi:predicted protein tyrosine phosphatase